MTFEMRSTTFLSLTKFVGGKTEALWVRKIKDSSFCGSKAVALLSSKRLPERQSAYMSNVFDPFYRFHEP